jgi:hypothetical protein
VVVSDTGDNTSNGTNALHAANHGGDNTATGYEALYFNTGSFNVANGVSALYANTRGEFNTALGSDALNANTTGSYNLALGEAAGSNLTTGSYNIDIGNPGVAGESGTIRIGTEHIHTSTYMAGIVSSPIVGTPVFITPNGRLGVFASAERYKTDIQSLSVDTSKLQLLRPVTFHFKTEPTGTLQYGLIAEEVAKVYPDLVVHDAEGRIDGVRYDELAPILLKQVQMQMAQLAADDEKLAAQQVALTATADHLAVRDEQLAALKLQFTELLKTNAAMRAALDALNARGSQTAMRQP